MSRDRTAFVTVTKLTGSVGTDHHPFPRLLDWVADAQVKLGFEAIVQRGSTPARPPLETIEFLPAEELESFMLAADVVVCHAGPGTLSLASRCGHRPIVVARDPKHGEHVDDHQMRYARRLFEEGTIDLAQSSEHLIDLVASAPERGRIGESAREVTERAAERFGELVDDLVAGRMRRRKLGERLLVRRSL
jgi:UDP-N-acetylglucosamine transferase subunit ALG13